MSRRALVLLILALGSLWARPQVQGLDSIGLVSDLDRSVDFYTKVLTFEKVSERQASGRLVSQSAGGTADELTQARSNFLSSGVVDIPDGVPDIQKAFIVRDPDGHAVEIVER